MTGNHRRTGPKPEPPRGAGTDPRVDQMVDHVVDQVMTKLSGTMADKLTEKAAKHEQMAAKAAKRAAALDQLASHLGALDIWMRAEPAGRRPRFRREEIAAAAVRIADAEGFDALSMRRLAAELGAGTMTLYHYVRTKDELLTLVTDEVMAEVIVPDDEGLPADWRAAMTVLAHRSRAAMARHPWILDITDDPAIGPNSVRHFDQSLEAVSSLDVDLDTRLDIITAVDEYVFGFSLMERNNLQADESPGDDMVDYVGGLLRTGTYPQLAALAAEMGLPEAWGRIESHFRDPGRFERNLERLLAGIESGLSAASATRA